MKYFNKKSEALKFLDKSNDKHLVLFQEDINKHGSKRFIIGNYGEIYNKIKKNKKSYLYESWTHNTPLCFSLDIDIKIDEKNPKKISFNKIVINNIKSVIYYAKQFYDYEYKMENIVVLKANKQPNKLSAHVIFRGLCFENYKVCKNFYNRMIKEKGNKLKYTDRAIYNLTCLRTYGSSKFGKDNILKSYKLTIDGKSTAIIKDFMSESDFFENSLITKINKLEERNLISKIVKLTYNTNYNLPTNTDKEEIIKLLELVPYEYCDEYKLWNRIAMILYSIDTSNFELFNEWSKKCPKKYSLDGCKKRWESFNNSSFNPNIFTITHLKYIAKEGGYKFDKESLEFVVNNYPIEEIKLSNTNLYHIQDINMNKLNSKVYKDILNKKFIALQSEKGTGKTYNLLNALFKENQKPPKSVLFISSRRTFGIKLSADLKKYGFELYSNISEYYIYNKNIICQIDSLTRLQNNKFDVVIIDECESLARYMGSSHFTKNPKSNLIISELEDRVESCDKLIIMDADLSDRCMNYYTQILDGNLNRSNVAVIRNNFTPYQNYTMNYMRYNHWLNLLMEKIKENKKIAIPMASNNKAKDLLELLKAKFPKKECLLIHKETKDEEKLQQLLRVNENWVNYDVVIYTPTVCMGVSFDPTYFDNIFAYGCHNSLGAQEFCQMLHRIRNPKDENIYVSLDHYKFYSNDDSFSYNEVQEMMCNDYYLTKYEMHENLLKKKFKRENGERILYYPFKDEPIYDLLIKNNVERVKNINNFGSTFFGYVKFKKYKLKYFECDNDKSILSELKSLRENRKEEERNKEVNGIFSCKTPSEEEIKELRKIQPQYLTDEQINQLKRYKFVKVYDIPDDKVTSDIIDEYYDRNKMLTYNNLSTIMEYKDFSSLNKLDVLKDNEEINIDYHNCYQNLTKKNKFTYHYYVLKMLDYFKIDINNFDTDNTIPLDQFKNVEKFKEFVEKEKYGIMNKFGLLYLNKYNFEKLNNNPKEVIKLLNAILNKQYGLKLKKAKDKSYMLTTNNLWETLPNGIRAKELKKLKQVKYNKRDTSELDFDLDSSDSESD